eukprot:jgi/Tetstr1/444038/TSEL_031977.t1
MPTYAISGASKGLGLELCKQLLARGDTVYALVRTATETLQALACDKLTVVPGIDVAKDDVGDKVGAALEGVRVDVLVCNAGAYGSSSADGPMAMFATQNLENVTMDVMREAFELNTLGPLRLTKALLPMIPTNAGAKIVITTSLLGSIGDNSGGGSYAYRTAKAGVNQVGKSLAIDLQEKGIAVRLIHPGMVATDFAGPDASKIPEGMRKNMRGVEESVVGMLQAIDGLDMSATGTFVHANYGEGVKPCPW